MTAIWDLPPELLGYIFTTLIRTHGVANAVRARSACKAFDAEIKLAIWTNKALEGPHRPKDYVGESIFADYITTYILEDRERSFPLTAALHEILDYMKSKDPQSTSHNSSSIQKTVETLSQNHVFAEVFPWFYYAPLNCTVAENALALAAAWRLLPLVERLVKDGAIEKETLFGYPLNCMVRECDVSAVAKYLNARAATGKGEFGAPRGISARAYQYAISTAVHQGSKGMLAVLLDAASQDKVLRFGKISDWQRIILTKYDRVSRKGYPLGACTRIEPFDFWSEDFSETSLEDALLFLASGAGHINIVHYALDHGANPNARVESGKTFQNPLGLARIHGHEQVIDLLESRGASAKLYDLFS